MNQEQFYNSVRGKTVTFCGIGRSHMPLMEKFQQAGALVSARDKRSLAELGENGKALQALGVTLILGEDYLQNLNEDIIFRTPGMRYHLPELEAARARGAAPGGKRGGRAALTVGTRSLQNLRRHWQRWEDHYHLDHRRAVEGPGEKRPPGWKHRQAPAAGDWVHPAGGLRCGGAFQLPADLHAGEP